MRVKEILILMCAITSFSTLNYSDVVTNNNSAVFSEELATSAEDAKNKVDMLEYLSTKHKTYYKNFIKDTNYETYLNRAIKYNEQMKPLKIVIDQDEEYRKTDLFINASESDKNAYIAAIDECKSQYNRQPSFSRESDSSIPATADAVKNAKKTIEENSKNSSSANTDSGTTDNNTQPPVPPAPPLPGGSTDTTQPSTGTTDTAVESAKTEIDNLTNLNENHKNYYKNQLTKENASSIVEKAKKVDTLMKPIKEAVDEYDKLKETAGYKNSPEDLKTSYAGKIEQAKEYQNDSDGYSKLESTFPINSLEVLAKSIANDKKQMAQNGDITTSTSGSNSTTEPTPPPAPTPDPAPNPTPQPDPNTGTGTGSSTNTGDGTGSVNPTRAAEIDAFTNLTDKFKAFFKNQLTGDDEKDAAVVRKAKSFNTALKDIVDVIKRENEIKSSQEYANAKKDETGKTTVEEFETLLESTKNLYYSDDPTELQKTSGLFSKAQLDGKKLKNLESEIKTYTTSSDSTTTTPPADDKNAVDKRRKEIKDVLNESPMKFRFTASQKSALETNLDNITTLAGLEEEYKKIQSMSDKMRDLRAEITAHKNLVSNKATEQEKEKMENLSQELKAEYDRLTEKAQNTTTDETFTPEILLTEQAIDNVINEFKAFKEKFNAFQVDTSFIDYVNEKVGKYKNLNESQKSKLRQELSANKDDESKKEEIEKDYSKLDEKMKEALDLLAINDSEILNNTKISKENKEKYKLAKTKLSDSTKAATMTEELSTTILEFINVKNEILPFDFSKYEEKVMKLSNTDVSIVNRFSDNAFLDVSLVNNVSSIYKAFASVKAGVSLNIEKTLNTKIGLFAEYDKKDSHHFAIGTNLTTDYFTTFVRYRLVLLDELISHNVDSYFGAKYKINVLDNFNITTNTALLVSYSSKLKLDEKVEMKDKFVYQVEAGARVEYILNSLTFSLDPKIKYLHDVVVLENSNKEIKTINNSSFLYDVRFEATNEFKNGLKFGGYIGLDGKVTKNPYVNIKLGTSLGYNF